LRLCILAHEARIFTLLPTVMYCAIKLERH